MSTYDFFNDLVNLKPDLKELLNEVDAIPSVGMVITIKLIVRTGPGRVYLNCRV